MNPFAHHAAARVAGLLAVLLVGCDKAPEPVAEPEQQEVILHVRTVDKTGAPVEMVRFYINGKKFGITDQDGAFKGRYPAKDGELLTFNVEAPPGYSVPANIDQSRWRHQVKYPGGRALQLNFTATLQRPERDYLFMVNAKTAATPVTVNAKVVGKTGASGEALVLVRGEPGAKFAARAGTVIYNGEFAEDEEVYLLTAARQGPVGGEQAAVAAGDQGGDAPPTLCPPMPSPPTRRSTPRPPTRWRPQRRSRRPRPLSTPRRRHRSPSRSPSHPTPSLRRRSLWRSPGGIRRPPWPTSSRLRPGEIRLRSATRRRIRRPGVTRRLDAIRLPGVIRRPTSTSSRPRASAVRRGATRSPWWRIRRPRSWSRRRPRSGTTAWTSCWLIRSTRRLRWWTPPPVVTPLPVVWRPSRSGPPIRRLRSLVAGRPVPARRRSSATASSTTARSRSSPVTSPSRRPSVVAGRRRRRP
ncbi:MAG: hypothetical protein R3F43_28490 [bacterium]